MVFCRSGLNRLRRQGITESHMDKSFAAWLHTQTASAWIPALSSWVPVCSVDVSVSPVKNWGRKSHLCRAILMSKYLTLYCEIHCSSLFSPVLKCLFWFNFHLVYQLDDLNIYGEASHLLCCFSLDSCPMTIRMKFCTCSLRNLWGMWHHRPSFKGPLAFLLWLLWCSEKKWRGVGGQKKWPGNYLHGFPPANLKRTGEMPGVLREWTSWFFKAMGMCNEERKTPDTGECDIKS